MKSAIRRKLYEMKYQNKFYDEDTADNLAGIVEEADEYFENSGYESYNEFLWEVITDRATREFDVNLLLPDVYKYIYQEEFTGDVYFDCKSGIYNMLLELLDNMGGDE